MLMTSGLDQDHLFFSVRSSVGSTAKLKILRSMSAALLWTPNDLQRPRNVQVVNRIWLILLDLD